MKLRDVQRNYDRLSRSYDFWNRWLSDPLLHIETLRARTVERLALERDGSVLDIGCGTGLNFPHLAKRVDPAGRIVGLDYSSGMLERARRRVRDRGWPNVTLVQGDAARLDGVEGPFDAVLSTWALGIVNDLPEALMCAVTVLRPGGTIAILDFHNTQPDGGLHRLLNPIYLWLLQRAGVDAPEDLDSERLSRRWRDGKAFLADALVDVREETYFRGTGFLLSGRKPA